MTRKSTTWSGRSCEFWESWRGVCDCVSVCVCEGVCVSVCVCVLEGEPVLDLVCDHLGDGE